MKVTLRIPAADTHRGTDAGGALVPKTEVEEYDLPEGTTVSDLIARLGISAYMPRTVLVNDAQRGLDTELRDGDSVELDIREEL